MQHPNLIRFLLLILIVTLEPELVANELIVDPKTELSGLDALAYFNSTEEFVDKPKKEMPVKLQLSGHCEGTPIHTCIEYIEQNRQQILVALPNNQEYWRAFHELINGAALELDLTSAYSDAKKDRSKLISAAYGWVYRTIAEDKIHSTTHQFVRYYKNIRRHMAESSVLADRMIFTALVGIAHWQFEILMTLHAADGDSVSIRILADALTPFSERERSLRHALQGEGRFVQAMISKLEVNDILEILGNYQTPVNTSEGSLKWARKMAQVELDRITDYFGEVTERSWPSYWGQGFSHPEKEGLNGKNVITTDIAFYESYARTARSSEVLIYLLLALSDIHLGLASPGVPARQAPPFWNWSWVGDTQSLCLLPTHVAPNSSDFSIDQPPCVTHVSKYTE